ncbi:hypothetical protein ACNVED_16550 (plasmid) [Legionella sp. D16C41]|uniref:hypothetical protein n=1 Tax=Legionella sp. D16C41 TaxID=3402688 RepID=UPI003AF768F6
MGELLPLVLPLFLSHASKRHYARLKRYGLRSAGLAFHLFTSLLYLPYSYVFTAYFVQLLTWRP